MARHLSSALFVYAHDAKQMIGPLQNNPHQVDIASIAFEDMRRDPGAILLGLGHVVVFGGLTDIKTVLEFATEHESSVESCRFHGKKF